MPGPCGCCCECVRLSTFIQFKRVLFKLGENLVELSPGIDPIMNRSGAPANCWLSCMIYVCYILNHIACGAMNGSIPLLVLYRITPDISIMLLYTFYQPVFYATHDQHFPSESEERAAFWVGFGEHCGDAMTHKLLDKITQKIIYRSATTDLK